MDGVADQSCGEKSEEELEHSADKLSDLHGGGCAMETKIEI